MINRESREITRKNIKKSFFTTEAQSSQRKGQEGAGYCIKTIPGLGLHFDSHLTFPVSRSSAQWKM